MRHCMFDLECMGLAPNAAISSIGACAFDPYNGEVDHENTFYVVINYHSTPRAHHGDLDMDTVMWWMQQSDEARQELTKPHADRAEGIVKISRHSNDKIEGYYTLEGALQAFTEWTQALSLDRLHSNPSTYDEVILRSAYKRIEKSFPFHWRNSHCFRTLKHLARTKGGGKLPDREELRKSLNLLHHRADHDALLQAHQVYEMYRRLGLC